MIISFAYTTPALLAGCKTVTRRVWKDSHAAKFTPGMVVDAWWNSPRFLRNGKTSDQVAEIEIVSVERGNTLDLVEADFVKEGFEYLDSRNLPCRLYGKKYPTWREFFEIWKTEDTNLWVVDFKLVKKVQPHGAENKN